VIEQRTPRRFAPIRAGIINLWDYRDEEFLFVDGWLVLRGPNGSGKTKALEVLFPFTLDGRIEPRRLNPFASEDRTMKANLLYRGQEVTHGYVWMEFGDGESSVTVGIGLRAHRHADRVTRWYFVADGRVGVELSLLDPDDRPLGRRDMIAQLGPDAVKDSPEEYRRLVDARLFGLGPARYEQMLDLVLTLRKPQLAKDLNPVELSRTLQRGLRPIDEQLVVDAAGSFDDMEAVARTLEGLVAADTATAGFIAVYSTYLRTHARTAADALAGRLASAEEKRAALAQARVSLHTARTAEAEAGELLRQAEPEPGRLRAHVESLRSSAAYQSHEQLADLQRHVADLDRAATAAQRTVATERATADKRRGEQERAGTTLAQARAAAHRLATGLATDAEMARIAWAAADASVDGLTDRVTARATGRRDDVEAVRKQAGRLAQAERDHAKAAADAAVAQAAVEEAEQREQAAEEVVGIARGEARAAVARWTADFARTLAELDLASLPPALDEAVGRVGEPGARTLREVYAAATAAAVAAYRDSLATLMSRRDTLQARHDEVREECDRIAAEHDDAPPALATRPTSREGRPGGPLWRLVHFADGVPDADQAGIESALHAAGLLDAWLHPDVGAEAAASIAGEQDGYLVALPPGSRSAGATLADILVPEEQDSVPADRIIDVLASIVLADLTQLAQASVAVGPDGRYVHGLEAGRYAKPAPEYIGATARAARRAARIAECERHLTELATQIASLDARRQALRRTLSTVDEAAEQLPPLDPIHEALRALNEAATMLRARHERSQDAAAHLDQALAERAAAGGALRRVVAERALPADQVDDVAAAVGRFERGGLQLASAYGTLAGAVDAEAAARDRHDEAVDRLGGAEQVAGEAKQRHREKDEAYRTLRAAVGADADRVLAEVGQVEGQIRAADEVVARARTRASKAGEARAAAGTRVEMGERELADAVSEAHREAVRLRPFAHADLLGLLRCPTDLRWPATPTVQTGPEIALAAEIGALHQAILAATRELTPTESSLKQSATRLTTALTDLQAQLPATGLDHRPEWDTDDGVIVVRVADEEGLTPVAHFAERIARERAAQEQLLTDAEQRVLEDALLTQLARQIHQRTIEARDLVAGMDIQMRARRMSSGLTVGVGWRLSDDLDTEQREVCKLLERDPARLGPAQLATLRRHFAVRIKTARAAAPERPYRDLLAEVLDYRRWRIFAFTLHRPGGAAEPLTRSRHSQLSGGEQSVSLHLPLFAAAHALFGSARPTAPRLLGLDEAFAGVDDTGRSELMSLARQFDLDLFMTGYDLWATDPVVRGAAHYDLAHAAIEHAVSTVLLVWNGHTNVVDFDGSLARALGSPETRRVPGATSPLADPVLESLDE
jgi:uncharacterized protein (TIGR02680 family)